MKTINIKDIYNSEVSFTANGFILEFWNDKYKVRLHFDFWWVTYIARNLWKIINSRKSALNEMEKNMKGFQ